MFVTTLLSGPESAGFGSAPVEAVRAAWDGGPVRWLASGVAAEFPMPRIPPDRWQVWADLQARGVDLIVQRAAGCRRRVLIADMDSTMIGQESLDELAAEAGVGEKVAAITARAMNGELDFGAALRERVGLLAGLDAGAIARVCANRISLRPGARQLVATMKANGGYSALVSGGFDAFSGHVAAALGFDEHHANVLNIRAGRLTGTVAEPILGRDAKGAVLRAILARKGLTTDDVMAVGDGANDLGMLGLAGAGVAFHAKPAVAAECDLRINHGDLTALLYIQGYRRDEFAASV